MTNVNEDNSDADASTFQFDVFSSLPTISVLSNNTLDIPRISFSELTTVTDNWNQRTVIGRGTFGCIFKGTWQELSVAVKSYTFKELNRLLKEIFCLKVYRHVNIIPLVAYNPGSTHKGYLVYEYIPGCSLSYRLKTKKSEKVLSGHQRLKIAEGIARGLHYLHTALRRSLVHRDVKAANILLRTDEEAVLSNFGIAYECSRAPTYEKVKGKLLGTLPYLPPEYLLKKRISTKLDVYSFGVVLLQLATGLDACSDVYTSAKSLRDVVMEHEDIHTMKDPKLKGGEIYFNWLLHLGQACVQELPKARPDMAVVLQKLI